MITFFFTDFYMIFAGFWGPGVAFFGILALSEAHPRPRGRIKRFSEDFPEIFWLILTQLLSLQLAYATILAGFASFFYADSCRRFVFWLIRNPFRGRFCSAVEGQNAGTPFLLIIPEGARARVRTRTRVRARTMRRCGSAARCCSYRWSWP